MNNVVKCTTILCSLLLLFACSNDNSNQRPYLESGFSELMETVCSETGMPGVSVFVISSKYGDFSLAYGTADLAAGTPVGTDQCFRIGSLTKSFTGAAVLKLYEDGLIDLDTPITDYLGVVNGYTPLTRITVRHLLNMSSGLPPYADIPFLTGKVLANPLDAYTPEALLAEAFDAGPDLLFEPGTEFYYTNTNYILLGMLIEAVSGQTYTAFITDNFIVPLGLSDTTVITDSTLVPGMARGYYDFDEDGTYEDWTATHMSYVWSAGCIVSNARDVAIWMDMLARGELVSEPFAADLFGGRQIAEGQIYGAGLVTDANLGIGHNGTVLGYHADAWYDPETDSTVAVLCNTNSPLLSDDRDPTREIATGILNRLKQRLTKPKAM